MLWGHSSDVSSVAFHPSGLTFATCSEDKTVTSNQDMAGLFFFYQFKYGNNFIFSKKNIYNLSLTSIFFVLIALTFVSTIDFE